MSPLNFANPLLSIGLPVFNGEKYLEEALDSLLGQTYQDFKLNISDNASTDRTMEICKAYAKRDSRIAYYRNAENIGAMQNWYKVFTLCSGEYYASVAHDDIYDPKYMQKCIEVLELDPTVVVCHSKTSIIDANGNYVGNFDVEVDTTSDKPHARIYNVLKTDYLCIQLYGVMRNKTLAATRKFSGYYGCDRNMLLELCLFGKVKEVPEYLFYHRLYDGALGAAMNSGKSLDELLLLDPGTDWQNRNYAWIVYSTFFSSIHRNIQSPIEQIMCYKQLIKIMIEKGFKRIALLLGKNGI